MKVKMLNQQRVGEGRPTVNGSGYQVKGPRAWASQPCKGFHFAACAPERVAGRFCAASRRACRTDYRHMFLTFIVRRVGQPLPSTQWTGILRWRTLWMRETAVREADPDHTTNRRSRGTLQVREKRRGAILALRGKMTGLSCNSRTGVIKIQCSSRTLRL